MDIAVYSLQRTTALIGIVAALVASVAYIFWLTHFFPPL